jgi:hypothetical protein
VSDSYPSGTSEWVPLDIERLGLRITSATGIATSVVPDGAAAGTWSATTLVDGLPCFRLSGFSPGLYRVRAQVTTADEVVVLDCGTVLVVP